MGGLPMRPGDHPSLGLPWHCSQRRMEPRRDQYSDRNAHNEDDHGDNRPQRRECFFVLSHGGQPSTRTQRRHGCHAYCVADYGTRRRGTRCRSAATLTSSVSPSLVPVAIKTEQKLACQTLVRLTRCHFNCPQFDGSYALFEPAPPKEGENRKSKRKVERRDG
jgi:hypothetical protein